MGLFRPTPIEHVGLAAALIALAAGSASALEHAVSPPHREDLWRSSSSEVTVSYYNLCNGWVWTWPGDYHRRGFGVTFAKPEETNIIEGLWTFHVDAAPGWGFEGTLYLLELDSAGTPDPTPITWIPYYPVTGWSYLALDAPVTGDVFAYAYVRRNRPDLFTGLTTDHPAAGPTGSAGCGVCYPPDRESRSRLLDPPVSGNWPGSPLNDGVCDAELVWEAVFGVGPTSATQGIETRTWGRLKALYR